MNELQEAQPKPEAGLPLGAAHGSAFDVWWHNEGSGMPPLPGEDAETHVRRICEIAWANGAYKANEALESIIKQQPCCEGGGCFYPMHDGEGNYIGENNVDPLGVIQGMVQTAQDALTPNTSVCGSRDASTQDSFVGGTTQGEKR